MIEPWELKPDDSRDADKLETFIIFCEDGVNEPLYFRAFQTEINNIKINTIENQRSGNANLGNTIQHCLALGLIVFDEGQYSIKDNATENLWCVYDRDLKSQDPTEIDPLDNIAFDTAIITAQSAKLKVAWSNDAFELWILLHFEDVPAEIPLHRNYIYSRLTEIFRLLPDKSEKFEELTQKPWFNYKDTFKRKINFLSYVLPLLRARRKMAIQRAFALEANYNLSVPYHRCNPCTKIHHLIINIINSKEN